MTGARALRGLLVAACSVGGLSGATYGLLTGQARRAKDVIGRPKSLPLNADGVYLPDGTGPVAAAAPGDALSFAMLGDSTAAGVGAETPEQLPGVLLAKGLAEESGRPVRLVTHAVSGAKTVDLPGQVDRALIAAPDIALVIIGGNDVTSRTRIDRSAALLAEQVSRLMVAGAAVVVGTCPDLGVVQPIPQPLRAIARRWALTLARAQRRALDRIGAASVPIADLLAPEFLNRPEELFSLDRFHPSGAGYEVAASMLLAPLCSAAGILQPVAAVA